MFYYFCLLLNSLGLWKLSSFCYYRGCELEDVSLLRNMTNVEVLSLRWEYLNGNTVVSDVRICSYLHCYYWIFLWFLQRFSRRWKMLLLDGNRVYKYQHPIVWLVFYWCFQNKTKTIKAEKSIVFVWFHNCILTSNFLIQTKLISYLSYIPL